MLASGKDSAGEAWDNEWQEIPGARGDPDCRGAESGAVPLQGKRLSEVAALWKEDAIDALCDILIKDKRVHRSRRLRHGRAGCAAGAEAAVGLDR
jgi:N-acyl-D-aspartate/D-glutamate deacylase